MVSLLQTLISLIAILSLSLAISYKFKISTALTPLIVLSSVMVGFSFFGTLSILALGAWVFYILAVGSIVYLAFKFDKNLFKQLITPGFILFVVASLYFVFMMFLQNPQPSEWDEFSQWLPQAKIVSNTNTLYTVAEYWWPWSVTQKPGFIMLSYMFNFFGEFAAWRLYAAYDVLIVSVWAAVIGPLTNKNWYIGIPATAAVFICAFFDKVQREITMSRGYMNGMVDAPMGILFGGALALYYACRSKNTQKGALCASIVLGALCMSKDTGLPLALVGAGIIAVDMLFVGENYNLIKKSVIASKIIFSAIMFAVPTMVFVLWSKYLSSIVGASQGSVGGASNFGYSQMIIEGLKMLFGITPSQKALEYVDKFNQIKLNMINRFLYSPNTIFGTGFVTALIIAAILFFVIVFTKDKNLRLRAIFYGIFSSAGFLAYFIFIGLTYVFVFKGDLGVNLVDYLRYIGTYYIAWFIGAVCIAVQGAILPSRFKYELVLLLALVGFGSFIRFDNYIKDELCFIDYPQVLNDENFSVMQKVEKMQEILPENAELFYLNSNDLGDGIMKLGYYAYPLQFNYSWGGGKIVLPEISEQNGGKAMSLEYFAANLVNEEITHIIIDFADEDFFTSYGVLFDDEGSAYKNGQAFIYEVKVDENCVMIEQEVPFTNFLTKSDGLEILTTVQILPNAEKYVTLVPVYTKEA